MRLSNKFTLTRIVLAPVFFILYFLPIWFGEGFGPVSIFVSIPLLGFMEFTDFLDGHYARKHNEVSDFGKLFDPFADVIVHMTTFVCFMFSVNGYSYMKPIIFVLILYREMTMTFLRMVAAKKGVAIAARKTGKLKTVVYVVTGFLMLITEGIVRLNIDFSSINVLCVSSFVLTLVCLFLSYFSFIDYIINFRSVLKD